MTPRWLTALMAPWLGLCAQAAETSLTRDPTLPPLAVRAAASTAATGAPDGASAPTGSSADPARHLMLVDGRPYLVERGWLRGVGDRWGDARIEKITAQAVWLRDAAGLHRHELYPGVTLRPATPTPPSRPRTESQP